MRFFQRKTSVSEFYDCTLKTEYRNQSNLNDINVKTSEVAKTNSVLVIKNKQTKSKDFKRIRRFVLKNYLSIQRYVCEMRINPQEIQVVRLSE